ncbi:MAG: DUF389 domain-containing protein [Chlorobium sp.]|jgi:uncharacterized hydrophobic protein (TIGR00271 family)|nr:DUF389 domain-containing protein [Chlorobium sp.]
MLKKIIGYFNLQEDVETFDVIHRAIENEIELKGSRLWILVFAIFLASVGLNINSTAVIIGAMLVSPLMGPINGMGYSIATYDFPLLRRSFKSFSFAVLASLVASTLYFVISPVSNAHSELLARTSPTIYDVLIALFGGLAGTVSLTTRLKGNVVPGVAIATALMPPLCTAGYGLATAQLHFFFGALYLFAINTVFIALSTVAFSQVMKFPIRNHVADASKARINRWITVIILVTLIPSIYFGYLLVMKEQFSDKAGRFVRSVQVFRGDYLLRSEIDADLQQITLIYAGHSLTNDDKTNLKKKAADFDLKQVALIFEQGISFSDITGQLSEKDALKSQITALSFALQENKRAQDSLRERAMTGRVLLNELRAIFPEVTAALFAEPYRFTKDNDGNPEKIAYVVVSDSGTLDNVERTKVKAWLEARLQNDSLRVVFEE